VQEPKRGKALKKAHSFDSTFHPYRGRYTVQGRGQLFGEPFWQTRHERLTLGLIEQAILDRLVVGFFVSTVPNVLGVDIDDHRGAAWTGSEASPLLLSLYEQTCQRLRAQPSLLVQSPHGLHGFWVLSERIPAEVLYGLARERLGSLPVEVKPTPASSLRIPAERRILDPKTLQLLSLPFELVAQSMPVQHPAFLFEAGYLPETIRASLVERRARARLLQNLPRIEKVEEELLPLVAGRTNEPFLRLCLAYRCAGLSVEEAHYRFALCLMRSPRYQGELRDARRLQQRIECEYRRNRDYTPKAREIQGSLFNAMIAERVALVHPFARQRTKPLQRFVTRILEWCDWHDEIITNPGQTAFFDYLYPYYRKNRREGLYPLPKSLLFKANERYRQLMPWLEQRGLIEASNYPYVPGQGICRYYRVEPGRFVGG